MKYEWETEEQFRKRQKEAKTLGEVVFRDDANMDFILDLIDNYIDIVDAIEEHLDKPIKINL